MARGVDLEGAAHLVLTDAVVSFDCRVADVKSVATHNVVFAAVVAVRLGRSGGALVYHERAYKQV